MSQQTNVPCTFSISRKDYVDQIWYNCYTCSKKNNLGVCYACAYQCHKDHELGNRRGEIGLQYWNTGGFFCDCGVGGNFPEVCKCYVPPPPGTFATFTPPKIVPEVDMRLAITANATTWGSVVSPVSLKMALEGSTFLCLDQNLQPFVRKFTGPSYQYVPCDELKVACGVFGATAEQIKDIPVTTYPINVSQTATSEEVNTWVTNATNGKITQLLDNQSFTKVIATALYFKGSWFNKFDPKLTNTRNFTGTKNGVTAVSRNCQFMKNPADIETNYIRTDGLKSIVLPYTGSRFTAIMTLPVSEGRSLYDQMKVPWFTHEWTSHLRLDGMSLEKVYTVVPKFKRTYRFADAQNIFKQAGFDWETFMDCTEFDRVVHSVTIEMDEEGTTGAASTAMMARGTNSGYRCEWVGDRPFLLAILDMSNGTFPFMGVIDLSTDDSNGTAVEEPQQAPSEAFMPNNRFNDLLLRLVEE